MNRVLALALIAILVVWGFVPSALAQSVAQSATIPSPSAQERRLSGEEIQKLFSGATLTAFDQNINRYYLEFKSDGTLDREYTSSHSGPPVLIQDPGNRWRVKDDKFCVKWQKSGNESCWGVLVDPDGKYMYANNRRPFLLKK